MALYGMSRTPNRFLDHKLCFDLWVELGTLEKVRQELCRRNIRHDLTGESFTGSGVREAALKFAVQHPQYAYEKMAVHFEGDRYEDFERWLVYKAMRAYKSEKSFRRWLKTMSLYDNQKYREIYDYRYPELHNRRD